MLQETASLNPTISLECSNNISLLHKTDEKAEPYLDAVNKMGLKKSSRISVLFNTVRILLLRSVLNR
jgi:hypothetical protein